MQWAQAPAPSRIDWAQRQDSTEAATQHPSETALWWRVGPALWCGAYCCSTEHRAVRRARSCELHILPVLAQRGIVQHPALL